MRASRSAFIVLVTALACALAGCKSTGIAYNPPGGALVFHHMYVSNAKDPGYVYVYRLPVTSSSTPTATVSVGPYPGELFVDSKGRLYVPEFSGDTTVQVYDLPLTASSSPVFNLTTSQETPESVAEDTAGNIYVSDTEPGGYIDVYDGPVNASASPSFTISNNSVGTTGLVLPFDIAIGPNGDLYASDQEDVNQFTPPFSTASTPSASVTPNDDNYGLRVDSSGRIFVANATGDGDIDVYASPLTNSSSPTLTFDVSSAPIKGLAFDGSGNLWAVDQNGALWKIPAPITLSSHATQVLTLPAGYGIVFGP